MAVAGVLATQLNTAAVRPKGLYLGGVDVLKDPVAGTWGVPIESIEVVENGPGAASEMRFSIDDPGIHVEIVDGMEVRYQDIANDVPLFLGWVDHFDEIPDFGDQGRSIVVSATGVEALLDWAITSTTVSVPNGGLLVDAIQAVIAAAAGMTELRAIAGTTDQSTQAAPIAYRSPQTYQLTAALGIAAGTTVREAIRQLIALSARGAAAEIPAAYVVTIDFWRGLRVYDPTLANPTDYVDVIIPSGGAVTEGLKHAVETATVRGVLVFGTVVTAIVTDGSGKPGPFVRIDDPTITTVTAAQAAGVAYLAGYATGVRGSYERQDHTPTQGVHPGSQVRITLASVELAAAAFRIASIKKTFLGSGRENWVIAYGLLPPSAVRMIRRLTRNVLN